MAKQYDINDPYDLDIMRAHYDNYSNAEWQALIDFSLLPENTRVLSFDERKCLIRMAQKAGQYHRPADKDIRWGLGLADKIERLMALGEANEDVEEALEHDNTIKARHVTFRVAWHDNKWDGSICKDPLKNRFCSGFHSLLSERLRKRKEKNLEQEIAFKGQPITEEYVPPCFWSVNLFGKKSLTVKHDNPADPGLKLISEELPAQSMFSWPFAVSFSRTNEQMKADGAYPRNLETVRIPKFNNAVRKDQSVAFMYAKFSNPLTEEDQQYLVVGCGLVTDKGNYHYFGPKGLIEKKKASKPKYRNFPSMNWAVRYSFQEPDLLVRMPYHEYLDYVNQPGFDAEGKEQLLNKIKVAITEPELNHCFKYVAMDVDDDEAIFILTKMRKQLIDCKDDGIVSPTEMQERIDAVEQLLSFCWKKRTYFPGFASICRSILNWDKQEFLLDELIEELQQSEQDEYYDTFLALVENPGSNKAYRKYATLLKEVKEALEDNYGLTVEQFLHLCMLNLKPFQYKRILSGKLKLSGDWKKTIEDERASHSLAEISSNPYLLYENYQAYDALLDPVTGEETDSPIDLFKIDVAYFPDIRFGIERKDLQRQMRNNDKRRLRALTIRYLRTLENTGHCFVDAEELENAIKAYPLFYNMDTEYQIPAHFFHNLKADYIIHFEETEDKVKVISENDTNYFYLYEVYKAEGEIEKVIHQLIHNESLQSTYPGLDEYIDACCNKLGSKLGDAFDEDLFRSERKQLYQNIYRNRLFVLAGNPGSGKSYELLNIISEWKKRGEKYLLLAPTGKAALRLKTDPDFKGIEAFTIDKVLADIRNKKMTIHTLQSINNIIIDEMSMVDLMKLRDLLRLINVEVPSFKRLVLVGDPHQLPAIGYGKVLKDILYYLKTNTAHSDKCIELQTNCRQELAESRILDFAEGYITDGEIDADLVSLLSSGKTDISKGFRVHFWNTEEELYSQVNEEFDWLCSNLENPLAGDRDEKLNQLFGLEKTGALSLKQYYNLENFQLITPYRSEYFGSGQINDYVQRSYKSKQELELINDWFKQSDKIIRTKNYYEKGKLILSNGSIGMIRNDSETLLHFPELDEPMPVYGEDGIRSTELEEFDLAYAITVHKAQGSGFNHCFFILPKKPGLLSKELIYTALTRSRESVTLFVQGDKEEPFEKSVLEKARSRSYTESRRTTLLLDKPYRYYALEVDGIFIESRVELLIYQALKEAQKEFGEDELKFFYEIKPNVGNVQLPMKTDFTLITKKGIWYWEHLGRLGNHKYEWTWHNVKKKTYDEYGLMDKLITTDERNGINPNKIKEIITIIVNDLVESVDKTNRYSQYHFSLR
ncbi:MAG: AAA family ATPase [Saprospiraceae bacterium]|nr:AAA family ATPase [Saprospiraceae bacterium]